ncbi:hypothetical protein OESDEN_09347 [Oesophagostomum dentatum]|uniref:RNase NYN domain-containing protein n=1 Tax=Oesophagostomum dentatum TaxID=61180 RepID=A0A0B1T5X5_OESDE|nr:hypothetical protein OESDEN_09347 [Oesophagostomum dentatum]
MQAFINYDDLYVTTLAARHGGCVLSGDKFKDILAQSTYSEFHHVILHRTLDVKFRFLPHEVVHHGADIFYKALPELFIYEDVAVRAEMISQKIFASPDDPEYSKVLLRRETWSEERRDERISAIDDMLAELCERNAIRPLALENLPGYQLQTELLEVLNNEDDATLDELPFSMDLLDQGYMLNEPWTDSSSSSANSSEACEEHASVGFAQHVTHFYDPMEQNYDCEASETSTTSYGGAQNLESLLHYDSELICPQTKNSAYILNSESKPFNTAYSQEDVLQEIVAHIDTLISARDKISKSKHDPSSKADVGELISFDDYNDRTSTTADIMEIANRDDDNVKPFEAGIEAPHSLHCERVSTNALSEEEISYNNSCSNENTGAQQRAEDFEIEMTLSAIFPANVVQQVLTVNASRNIAFLADQCADLCSQ